MKSDLYLHVGCLMNYDAGNILVNSLKIYDGIKFELHIVDTLSLTNLWVIQQQSHCNKRLSKRVRTTKKPISFTILHLLLISRIKVVSSFE